MQGTKKPHRHKGTGPQFRKKTLAVRQPHDSGTPNELRVLRRLWGRLEEWEFRKNHGQDLKHDHPLWVKITRCSHWTPGSTASSVGLRVKKLEQDYKVQRLQQWRARLRGSETATFQWLRSKPQRFQHDMFNDTVESSAQASSSMHEALDFFFLFGIKCGSAQQCLKKFLQMNI